MEKPLNLEKLGKSPIVFLKKELELFWIFFEYNLEV